MGVMEGIELLLRRAQRFAGATEEEINEAGNLVVALAQFPLALDQAGAYIEETGCSLGDCAPSSPRMPSPKNCSPGALPIGLPPCKRPSLIVSASIRCWRPCWPFPW